MRALAFLLMVTVPAFAQEAEVQKQLLQRLQQSDAFLLQLRQSQERLKVLPSDLKRLQELDSRQTSERQRLDSVSERR